ncbi:protein of unknown function DUF1232 [Candidatus Desulforudis audaxviator MP104C]|uniref:DUF1232 domain-containing protein n=1 Tax=Desulforudis audaxviator (strain MP104C) TaxID=477974 RepID=B1I252_DESAP|nr:protein of unknown function DUF1232 [Candidatus Desulforudis audaxviator MP104C]
MLHPLIMAAGDGGRESVRELWMTLLPVLVRLPRYARLVLGLSRDSRVAPPQKALLAGAILYNFSPVDLIPSVVPVLGQLDDLAVLLFAVRSVVRNCPGPVAREYLCRCGLTARHVREDPEVVRRTLRRVVTESGRLAGRKIAHGFEGITTRHRAGFRQRD